MERYTEFLRNELISFRALPDSCVGRGNLRCVEAVNIPAHTLSTQSPSVASNVCFPRGISKYSMIILWFDLAPSGPLTIICRVNVDLLKFYTMSLPDDSTVLFICGISKHPVITCGLDFTHWLLLAIVHRLILSALL